MKYGDIGYLNGFGVCLLIDPSRTPIGTKANPLQVEKSKLYFLTFTPKIPPIAVDKKDVQSMWSHIPTLEELDVAIKSGQRTQVPDSYDHRAASDLLRQRYMGDVGEALRLSKKHAAADPYAGEIFTKTLCAMASVHVYRTLEEQGKVGHVKGLLTKKERRSRLTDLMKAGMHYVRERGEELREIAVAEELSEMEADLKAAQEQEAAAQAQLSDLDARKTAQEARKENAGAMAEKQLEIVMAAADYAREKHLTLTQHDQAVNEIEALYVDEKIGFRNAIILLRHAFKSTANVDETVALVNDHNPPSKGPIEVSKMRKQLQAAINGVSNTEGVNDNCFALMKHMNGLNPKRHKFV